MSLAAAIRRGNQVAASQLTAEPRNQFDKARESIVNAAVGARGLALQSLEFPLEANDGMLQGTEALVAANIAGVYKFAELTERYHFRVHLGFGKIAGKWVIGSAQWFDEPIWTIPSAFVRSPSTNSLIVHADWPGVDELKSLVDEAFTKLRDKSTHTDRRYLVIVPPDRAAYVRLGGRGIGHAVTLWGWDGEAFKSDPPYFALDPNAFDATARSERRTLVLHEMTHVILGRDTMPFVPSWILEGVAMYFSDDFPLDTLKRSSKFSESVTLVDLTSDQGPLTDYDLSDERVRYKYALSGAAVAYLADRFGIDKVLKFVEGYKTFLRGEEMLNVIGGIRPMHELAVKSTDPLLKRHFSLSIEDLDREAKTWGGSGG